MNLRRTLATTTAGIALISAVAACGFNYPTDKVNNITAGSNYRDGTVYVLNAAIVSKTDNLGTFVATFANTSQKEAVTMTSMTGDGAAVGQVDVTPFTINAKGIVNLATEGGIAVQGTYSRGQFVTLSIGFDNGEQATLSVPVVNDDGQWLGLDTATPSPTASDSSSPSATSSPSETSTASASPS